MAAQGSDMAATLQNGARFSFIRVTGRQDTAMAPTVTYRVTIETPNSPDSIAVCALTSDDSPPQWTDDPDRTQYAEWIVRMRESLARQIQRAGRRGDWPRKLRQWKAEPEA